jgi:adenosine deaminase
MNFKDICVVGFDLSADRITRGLSAIYDENLLKYLYQNKILLEISPTSNILTGIVSSIKDHPIRQFKDRGIKITINLR